MPVGAEGKGYRWGHFEFQEEVIQRCCAAVLRLLERHPQVGEGPVWIARLDALGLG